MGIFDWFSSLRAGDAADAPKPFLPASSDGGDFSAPLEKAASLLEAGQAGAAIALYREVLGEPTCSGAAIARISGDLGRHHALDAMIELLTPVYLPEKHGAAAGINLLQAFIKTDRIEEARHLLNLLFRLGDQEYAARLHGFANALTGMRAQGSEVRGTALSTVTVSRPLWFYGLEDPLWLLPEPEPNARKIVFADLAVSAPGEGASLPAGWTGLARALPAFCNEVFRFRAGYKPLCLVGLDGRSGLAEFANELSRENIIQIGASLPGECDYVVSGFVAGDSEEAMEVGLRVWESKRSRERKLLSAECAAGDPGEGLHRLIGQLLYYMEAGKNRAGAGGISYEVAGGLAAYLRALAAALPVFLEEKGCLEPGASDPGAALAACAEAARSTGPGFQPARLLLLSSLLRAHACGRDLLPEHVALLSDLLDEEAGTGSAFERLYPLIGRLSGGGTSVAAAEKRLAGDPDADYRLWRGNL